MDSDQGKLFIGGISWETNEDRLKEYFGNYGEVLQVTVMRDKITGRPRGFGFIIFADPSVLDRVLQDKHDIDGREVDVKRAMSREEQQISGRSGNSNSSRSSGGGVNIKTKKIFVGGLPPALDEDGFRQYFDAYGHVTDVVIMIDQNTKRPRGFGFISFDSEEAVDRVLHKTFHDLNGKQVEVKRALPKDANPGVSSRTMGGGGYQGYGGDSDGRMDSNRYMQPQNTGSGFPSYGSSGYGAGYGYGSNGVGYGGYGGFAGATAGYGGPAGAAYGNASVPAAGYGSSPAGAPRSSWANQAPAGYGNLGYGNVAPTGYGGPGSAPAAQLPGYGYGAYGGTDPSYGNPSGYGAVGGRSAGAPNNGAGGELSGNGAGGYMAAGYGDGGWRSDPSQGYAGVYSGGQGAKPNNGDYRTN